MIDADAHVLENERTWSYLADSDRRFKPMRYARITEWTEDSGRSSRVATPAPGAEELMLFDAPWVMRNPTPMDIGSLIRPAQEGTLLEQGFLTGDEVPIPDGARNMTDIAARLKHMDELGIELQVIYPTIFLRPFVQRAEAELALCRSYNRWMADVWAESKGRLRWAAVLPLRSMERALEELRTARTHGACAVLMLPIEFDNRLLNDPYFFPLYQEASTLDVPICVHTGTGSPDLAAIYWGEAHHARNTIGPASFLVLLGSSIPDRFPDLRFGFIEFSADWVPYAVRRLMHRFERLGKPAKQNMLRDNHVYVACQTHDDLPYIVQLVGDENLVAGTDYGHSDTSTQLDLIEKLKARSGLPPASVDKILNSNARALYGL